MRRIMQWWIFILTLTLFFSWPIFGFSDQGKQTINYEPWARVLKTYVNDHGRVDYAALQKNNGDLNQFIKQIGQANVELLPFNEKKAFWINTYNALTIKTVIEHYPVKSIKHIALGLVWKQKKRIAGKNYSLDDIEHKILRSMGDPRIHFAINCASLGCPKLPQEPFYPDRLNEQLEQEAIKFMNDLEKVKVDRSNKTLYYSSLLEWYKDDFLSITPDLLGYIKRYINDDDRNYLETTAVSIEVIPYDWGLNKQ